MTGADLVLSAATVEALDAVLDETDSTALRVLPVVPPATLDRVVVAAYLEQLDPVDRAQFSEPTWRAYLSDFHAFTTWCTEHGISARPATPETVRAYLVDQADTLKLSTLRRRLTAISAMHQLSGLETPTRALIVRQAWKGLSRIHRPTQPTRRVEALITDKLAAIVAPLGESAKDKRDRALLVMGFAGAFRRSELAALNVADIELQADGLLVTLRRSKTDQTGEGRVVGLPYGSHRATCPVRSWLAWREAAQLDADGPAFLSMRRGGSHILPSRIPAAAIAQVVKTRAAAVGMDPRTVSGHSMRAGFVTAAAFAGLPDRSIMRQTGHTNPNSLTQYVREARTWEDNPAAKVGL
ncbi:tyrosine-type recombinase/integrase [Kineococcus rhizosphaerae]|uniref:Site-specific recombinase XerD n=1 Tax=Kineococcus rhizosphaerae TaxID=559628 RepID=A0A2T0QTK2_9ACTN|nr:tyrosine-type recombinase/integrase [Kineococcus rhizosphaerae]PRY08407.1 site-specific recombinase XerD [Kineococcus rhizosphaerae]